MKCAWQAYLNLVPVRLREDVDRLGSTGLQELRLRLDRPPEMVLADGSIWLDSKVTKQDLEFTVNIASRYSPWAAQSVRNGYITGQGGHRVGICGEAVITDGQVSAVAHVTSVCIRTARDFPGISKDLAELEGSILIIGSPGSGKTTLLRDLIRQSSHKNDFAVGVVDERQEIFPLVGGAFAFPVGARTDILTGCTKRLGVEMLLRTMTPGIIAVDEITETKDCEALLRAGWCGTRLLATAHASNRRDLENRTVYRPLLENGLFQYLVTLKPSKNWVVERMDK